MARQISENAPLSIVTPCVTVHLVLMPLHLGTGRDVVARKRKQPETRYPSEIVQIGVRVEEKLRRRLERAASQGGQSMNAEIIERLKRSFQSDEDKISLIARAIIDTYPDIANRIEELSAEATLWRDVQRQLGPDVTAPTASTFRAALSGPTGDLLRALATAISLIETRTGKKWNEDRDTASQVKEAMSAVLWAFVFPLDAARAIRHFEQVKQEESVQSGQRIRHPFIHEPGMAAALEALQKMGMAPSDAEIAETGEEYRMA